MQKMTMIQLMKQLLQYQKTVEINMSAKHLMQFGFSVNNENTFSYFAFHPEIRTIYIVNE